MRWYLPRHGRRGLDMMQRTATVQVNLDFEDEANAAAKLRTANGVTSIVTALFAASPVSEGRPTGMKSCRASVWLDTDESRCGLLSEVFQPEFGFDDYVAWALDVPMLFVVRGAVYHRAERYTFRRLMREGWEGSPATMGDWERHLSTLFPEVRLKRVIELRGADSGPLSFATGLAALWRGILDDAGACAAAWRLVERYSFHEREALRRDVPGSGLAARFGRHRVAELAVELCDVARAGLRVLPGGSDDQPLLDEIDEYARAGRCPADDMLDDVRGLGGDPAALVRSWRLRVSPNSPDLLLRARGTALPSPGLSRESGGT